ncbi:MAG: asparagine synthase (glutamine-hydrolyzing) [Candidatus Deferrimicrobiaceae bacterium]
MCGILGYSLDPSGDARGLDPATGLDTLGRRGPDGRGRYAEERVWLGHTRLSIIDLSTGDQPMANEDGSLQIVFNGEIYNYVELRKELIDKGHRFGTTSDTEVILHLYEEHGSGCLAHLRGMFAFALWDRRQGILFLARDRMGVKPLVYHEGPRGFSFASEIQALFALDREIPRECDLPALDHYLTLQYIPSPMTAFRAVRKLSPAHYLIVKDGRIRSVNRYWDIPYDRLDPRLSFPDACERMREIFLEATRIRLRSDVPFGAFLSGGIDSSIVVAAMSRILGEPVRTFSVGFGVKGYDELGRAKEVALACATEHTEFRVEANVLEVIPEAIRAFGEPFGDSSIIPTYYLSKMTSKHVKVALTGDGGDETFAGYKRFRQLMFIERLERLRLLGAWKAVRRLGLWSERMVNPRRRDKAFPLTREDKALFLAGVERYAGFVSLYNAADKEALYGPLLRETRGDVAGYWKDRSGDTEGLSRYLYMEQTGFLPEDVLCKVDICSMLNSLECRSPLLDHVLVEFAASLPGEYKLRGKEGKLIFRKTFGDWFRPGFFDAPKVGFAAPTHVWLKGELGDLCRNEILTSRPMSRLLKRDAVVELFHDVESNHKKIWNLYMLSQWFPAFRVDI